MNSEEEIRGGRRFSKRFLLRLGGIVLVLALLTGGAIYWWYSRTHEWTDDATIEAHVMPISSKVPGQVASVAVDDNQAVKSGDLLVQIDPRDFQVRLDQAQASLLAAQAQARRAEAEAKRRKLLFARGQISQQSLDNGPRKDILKSCATSSTGAVPAPRSRNCRNDWHVPDVETKCAYL